MNLQASDGELEGQLAQLGAVILESQVTYLLDLLMARSKGILMCFFPHWVHFEHGRASCPLPVSMITD